MRITLVLPALLVVLLAACGGSPAPSANPAATGGPTSTAQPTPAGGKVDCATIRTASQQLLAVQLLAQLRTTDSIEPIRTKQIGNLDLDAFLGGMHELHALDSYASALGDPKAAIDYYEKAGRAAQVLFATNPITQPAIDTYLQNVGTVTDFIGHQVAISAAMGAAGC